MEVLFVHPNFPGQFKNVARAFAAMPGVKAFGLGDASWIKAESNIPGVELITYQSPAVPQSTQEQLHPYCRGYDLSVRRAEQVLIALTKAKVERSLEPEVVFCHPGFGDAMFLKDIFPGTRVIGFFEYYYHRQGADLGFDPEFPATLNDVFRVRSMNATQLMALDACDSGFTPTYWQRSRFPNVWQKELQVLHEGIDTRRAIPDASMTVRLEDGTILRAGDEVLTYVSRCLEPYRGYHVFMRALPTIMAARPGCHVVIVGSDEGGYGKAAPAGTTHREIYLSEVKARLDMSRVHFIGRVSYDNFMRVLQISRLHIYLTYPFVLSWSMLEAMSCGCVVLGSATPPVEEVITDGVNGLLVDFHGALALAERAIDALANPQRYEHLRIAARQSIIDHYDFDTISLPAYQRLLRN